MDVLKGNETRGISDEPGISFGFPYLRLTNGSGQQLSPEIAAPNTGTRAGQTIDASANQRVLKAVRPLANIEDAVARLEKTTRKVLTNSRLGLGATPPKPELSLGATPPKPELSLGATPPKPELSLGATPPKPELSLGLLSGSMLFDNGGSMAKVTGLFREVVSSLQLVEEAVGNLEGVVYRVLTGPTNGIKGSKPDDYQPRLEKQVTDAFRELKDAAVYAKLTLGAVLQHPSQGLGPTQGDLGAVDRQQLAMFGGLSQSNLRLL